MTEVVELFSYSLSVTDLVLLAIASLFVGMAKTGVSGLGMMAMPMLAIVFGGKPSTGVLLIILIFADLFAVWYYNRHADWTLLRILLPLALAGILFGTYVGHRIDDQTFRHLMAVIIFASLGIMIWRERSTEVKIPESKWFVVVIGLVGGFATMVGNLAGSVMALYFLSMRLPKHEFIGTAAWFFLVVNVVKVPFHVGVWETITVNSALLSAITLPAVALGAFLGILVVKRIPERHYRYFVIAMTGVSAVAMVY